MSVPGDLMKRMADAPDFASGELHKHLFTVAISATAAEINAGKYLVKPGYGGYQLKVTGVRVFVTTALTTLTDLRIQTDAATPVVIATVVAANLTTGAKWDDANAEVVLGAGFDAVLAPGVGIQVVKTGSSAAGGPAGMIRIEFEIAR